MRTVPRYGVLINIIDRSYEAKLWLALVEAAKSQNVNLVCFPGRILKYRDPTEIQLNVVYNFVNQKDLDGLIIVSSTLANAVSHQEFTKFCTSFRYLPVVSIGIEIENIPSITIDNKSGMKQAIQHLISAHDHRRIAFVTGARGHQEAEIRLEAYLEVLKENQFPIEKQLILEGNFERECGKPLMYELIYEKNIIPDAVVFSNDNMAISAATALHDWGFSIPNNIAIVGFDNVYESEANLLIPITTVEQPLSEMATVAIKAISHYRTAGSFNIPNLTVLPTRLVFRASCGCLPSSIRHTAQKIESQLTAVEGAPIETPDRPELIDENQYSDLLHELLVILERTNDSDRLTNRFLDTLEPIFETTILSDTDALAWNSLIDNLFIDLAAEGHSIEQLFQQFEVIRDYISHRRQIAAAKVSKQVWYEITRRDLMHKIAAASNLEDLIQTVNDGFPTIDIYRYCIYLYDKEVRFVSGQKWNRPERMNLITAYRENEFTLPFNRKRIQRSDQIIPNYLISPDEQCTLLVYPLYQGEYQIGLFVFEYPLEINFSIFESLYVQLSSAIKGAFIIKEDQIQSDKLQKKSNDISTLNHELEHTKTMLREKQKEIIHSLKQKTKFLANMSHELRTPLNSIKGVAELLLFGAYKKDDTICNELEFLTAKLQVALNQESGELDNAEHLAEFEGKVTSFLNLLQDEKSVLHFYLDRIVELANSTDMETKSHIFDMVNELNNLLHDEKENYFRSQRSIIQHSNYLLRLVDLVIDMAKVDQQKYDFKPENIDPQLILRDMASYGTRLVQEAAKLEDVNISVSLGAFEEEEIQIDRGIVSKILQNFIDNAVRHTDLGSITILLEQSSESLFFSVSDTGCGIEDNKKQNVFREFKKVEDITNNKGVGLGLVLCDKLVKLHGGQIGFESKKDVGSQFWFSLPKDLEASRLQSQNFMTASSQPSPFLTPRSH